MFSKLFHEHGLFLHYDPNRGYIQKLSKNDFFPIQVFLG